MGIHRILKKVEKFFGEVHEKFNVTINCDKLNKKN